MPDPDTPVTVVKTPRGTSTSRSCRLFRVTPRRRSQPLGAPRRSFGEDVLAEKVAAGLRGVDSSQAIGRTTVENLPAVLTGGRADIDDPVGMADHVELVFDDEERIAGVLQPIESAEQCLGVRRMKAGRRLVENIHDAEEIRMHLRGQPQALQFARRERWRAAFERQIAEPEIEQHGDPREEVLDDPLVTSAFSGWSATNAGHPGAEPSAYGRNSEPRRLIGILEMSAMSRPANVTESDSRRSRLP